MSIIKSEFHFSTDPVESHSVRLQHSYTFITPKNTVLPYKIKHGVKFIDE